MQGFHRVFLPIISGNFDGISTDIDGVDDILSDCMTDESEDAQTDGKFAGSWTIGYLPLLTMLEIFTVNSADGIWKDICGSMWNRDWMDG